MRTGAQHVVYKYVGAGTADQGSFFRLSFPPVRKGELRCGDVEVLMSFL
jgi:hypothetical protein